MTVFLIAAAATGWAGLLTAVFQGLCLADQVDELNDELETARALTDAERRQANTYRGTAQHLQAQLDAADLAIGYLEERLASALPTPKTPAVDEVAGGTDTLTDAQRGQLWRAAR